MTGRGLPLVFGGALVASRTPPSSRPFPSSFFLCQLLLLPAVSHPSVLPSVQDLVAAGLECLLPHLETWKGFTVAGPLPGIDGGRNVEVYLQRWPADKKVGRKWDLMRVEFWSRLKLTTLWVGGYRPNGSM